MIYDIQSKSDFQIGATLTVRIPEQDLDRKAMNTILSDRPEFVLPFRHRMIDGQIEFIYQIGNRSKISYLSGTRSPSEYANMWVNILQPLLDCDDWFMTPYSFVLLPEHLYCDKATNVISYMYIPSLRACSDEYALKRMLTEVAKLNHVTDVTLENKVVWAIQDFNIKSFLHQVKTYGTQGKKEAAATPAHIAAAPAHIAVAQQNMPVQESAKQAAILPCAEVPPPDLKTTNRVNPASDEILIDFPADGKPPKEKKQKGRLFGLKKEKEVRPKSEPKAKGGLWGKKKAQQEIIEGAVAMPKQPEVSIAQPLYSNDIPPMDDDVTQLDVNESTGPRFRYVGVDEHPKIIEVTINAGSIFTIGRFDASVGTKQSSFEFDKKTKAVSRRHAVVERRTEGYYITDLDSGAGTFLNGQKLPPNAPFKLEYTCHVSFGHSGADYIWEE